MLRLQDIAVTTLFKEPGPLHYSLGASLARSNSMYLLVYPQPEFIK